MIIFVGWRKCEYIRQKLKMKCNDHGKRISESIIAKGYSFLVNFS